MTNTTRSKNISGLLASLLIACVALGNLQCGPAKPTGPGKPKSPRRNYLSPEMAAQPNLPPNLAIRHPDWKRRIAAVVVLAEMKGARTRAYLRIALRDEDHRVRKATVEAMVSRGDKSLMGVLAKAMKDENEGVRIAALRGLVRFIGAAAITMTLHRLGSGSAPERKVVIDTLGSQLKKTGPKGAAPAIKRLIIAIKSERPSTQKDAAKVLIKAGGAATPGILDALAAAQLGSRGDWMGKLESVIMASGVAGLRSLLTAVLQAAKSPKRARAAAVPLSRLGQAAGPLVRLLDYRLGASTATIELAKEILGKMGEPAAAPLIANLSHARADQRLLAALLLQKIGSKSAFDGLLALMTKETDRTVRLAGMQALGALKDPRGAKAVLAALEKDVPAGKKFDPAPYGLYRDALIALKPAADLLTPALKSKLLQMQLVATQVVAVTKVQVPHKLILKLLRSKKSPIKAAACMAAGALKIKKAIKRLRKYGKAKDLRVWRRAVEALGVLGDGKKGRALAVRAAMDKKMPALQVVGLVALGRMGKGSGGKTAKKMIWKESMAVRLAAKWARSRVSGKPAALKNPDLCNLIAAQVKGCFDKAPKAAPPAIDLAAFCVWGHPKVLNKYLNAGRCKPFRKALAKKPKKAAKGVPFVSHWDDAKTKKYEEAAYLAGNRHGLLQRWGKDGTLQMKCRFLGGRRHGRCTTFYPEGGKRVAAKHVGGVLSGRWQSFHANGATQLEGDYASGKRVDTWTEYYANGKQAMVMAYLSGLLVGKQVSYYKNGKQSGEAVYVAGRREGAWKTYHRDGGTRSEGLYNAGLRVGTWTWYHKSGKKRETGNFTKGIKSGTWQSWDASGEMIETCIYDDTGAPKCGR